VQAFGVTEPTSGADTLALKTFAAKDGDHYVERLAKQLLDRSERGDNI